MNLPNLISLARLLSVPLTVWLILEGRLGYAFWLFVASGVSDAIDGFLARRLNAVSTLGSYLDPLADKALLVGVYVTLGYKGHLEVWLAILVVSRDIMIVGGALLMVMMDETFRIEPSAISKVNTTAQIVLAALVLGRLGLEVDDFGASIVLTFVVAATTLGSGGGYLVAWYRRTAKLNGAK